MEYATEHCQAYCEVVNRERLMCAFGEMAVSFHNWLNNPDSLKALRDYELKAAAVEGQVKEATYRNW